MIYTTLNKIQEHQPLDCDLEKLLTHLGKTQADNEPLSLLTILESNGLDDAIWCLRTCEGIDREARLFAVACARRAQHLMKDQRSIDAINVAERYANGESSDDELAAAYNSAWAAFESIVRVEMFNGTAAWSDAWSNAGAALTAASDAAGAAEAVIVTDFKWKETEFRRVFCS